MIAVEEPKQPYGTHATKDDVANPRKPSNKPQKK